ncbi:aldo/keto reductase [Kitasatospora sp. NPDC097643]|uniref:aldo/keto reductase n=1 Tax=Kitasatospora sp. NPDC097643 TaxID=3157230 RepID=UPI00331AE809
MKLRHNPLGHSLVRVSELAFGAAGIGNLFTEVGNAQAEAAVAAAWECGVRYFDTAPHYGLGLSERRLGEALRAFPRHEFTVSTKVGRILEPVTPVGDDLANGFAVPATHRRRWDFTATGVRRSIEESLDRLGLDRIDIAYLHDPDDHADQALTEAYPELERLRAEGVLGAIGVGMNQAELPARFVRETDIDAVLLAGRYSLLDQRGLDELLPLAAERGVGVVVGGVFNSGLLADPKPGATFDYSAAPAELLDRALRLKETCERYGVPLRAAALRFPFGHPAVASVLVGTRSAAEARDAAAMLDHPVPDELWAELKETGLLPADVPTPVEAE